MMTWVDFLIIAIFGAATVKGFRRGLIVELTDLVITVAVILLAVGWFRPLADWLVARWQLSVLIAKPVALIGIWLFGSLVLEGVFSIIYWLLPARLKNNFVNRILGIVPAVLKTGVLIGMILTVLSVLTLPKDFKSGLEKSRFAKLIQTQSELVLDWFEGALGTDLEQALRFFTTPDTSERVAIPKIADDKLLREESNFEEQLLEMVNRERTQNGLISLEMDSAARVVARAHSRDMWVRGYFGHVNPDGESPFDRIREGGVEAKAAGENLALAPTVEIAHTGLMNSLSHRENILNPEFRRVGIGIISAGSNGLMVTQNFMD